MLPVALLILLALSGCERMQARVETMERTPLAPELEAELREIEADPIAALGLGEKTYLPYEIVGADRLIRHPSPAVTRRLAWEALGREAPRNYRLVMLHILSRREDAAADGVLVAALGDPVLRPMAAFLIGRAGFKGYPKRSRDSALLLAALRPHLADSSVYDDPWHGKSYPVQDFAIAAFVRVAGPQHFRFADRRDADLMGYELPRFADDHRRDLLEQCLRYRVHP